MGEYESMEEQKSVGEHQSTDEEKGMGEYEYMYEQKSTGEHQSMNEQKGMGEYEYMYEQKSTGEHQSMDGRTSCRYESWACYLACYLNSSLLGVEGAPIICQHIRAF
ncbi:hypothetical protein PoB_007102100 [Plakobranchus ocellatus]|uniref:Uncharacterized protein n=1 Tax=Plakobranchus ocellatus TaxID=259542 RepID=A0AAV4DKL9_9GAST|nr:hypothetical protein PoB_007102100 [Plakobranchus ocellatus]